MKGTVLITKGSDFSTMKISASTILKIIWGFSFIVALIFFLSTYVLHIAFEKSIRAEIRALDERLSLVNNEVLKAQDGYNKLFTKNFERANSSDIISSVNPNIGEEDIKEWVEMIFFNSDMVENHLSKISIEKLKGKRGINSLSIGAGLILSIGAVESDFYLKRSSHKGAAGGMQLASSLAKELGIKNRYDPKENIKGGIKHIIYLLKRYKKYPDQIELSLAAYNAGHNRVSAEWITQWGAGWEDIRSELQKDNNSFTETRKYVKTIKKLTRLFTGGNWADMDDNFWYRYKWEIPRIVD
ncbi:lytic transglycosylase domain-containing protein [candidate division KSB1 bacterium]